MKLYLKYKFKEFEASMLSNRQMIYKLFPEMNYIFQKSIEEKNDYFLKIFTSVPKYT